MEEPPSVLGVEVFDFDGPFDQDVSLGHAEINFLKHTSTELANMWVMLEGKLAQSSQSKLHLRIFLDNNKGVETIKDYLEKKEKEVGKKVSTCICNLYFSPSILIYLLFLTISGWIAVESSITSKQFYIPEIVWLASRRVSNQ